MSRACIRENEFTLSDFPPFDAARDRPALKLEPDKKGSVELLFAEDFCVRFQRKEKKIFVLVNPHITLDKKYSPKRFREYIWCSHGTLM